MSRLAGFGETPMTTIPRIIERGRRHLSAYPHLLEHVEGGSDTEATLERNRAAFERWLLMPRILRDVSEVDISATVLGEHVSMPVVLAPIGSLGLVHPDGALGSARGAHAAGTAAIVGMLAEPGFDAIAGATDGPLGFQLYIRGDDKWLASLLGRVEEAGYKSIHVTGDSAIHGRREQDIAHGYESPSHPAALGTLGARDQYMRPFSWRDFARLRDMTKLPLVVKGVMSAEDAKIAVDNGADCVYVSNHGGRQLDCAPSSLEQLPSIAAAVRGHAEVGIDGGFVRGTDIVKAVALGATWVGLGKLQALALAAGGADGVQAALSVLKEELTTTLALMGCTSLSDLSPDSLLPA
jgi:isopentenyl diphosphate isomerase/L-lactate dehydrogenase-like FMN-dependent dehydrogenase